MSSVRELQRSAGNRAVSSLVMQPLPPAGRATPLTAHSLAQLLANNGRGELAEAVQRAPLHESRLLARPLPAVAAQVARLPRGALEEQARRRRGASDRAQAKFVAKLLEKFGQGAAGIFKGLWRGLKRTGRGYRPSKMAEVGLENERARELLFRIAKTGVAHSGPLFLTIELTVGYLTGTIFDGLAPELRKRIVAKAVRGGIRAAPGIAAKSAGKTVAKAVAKKLATQLATRLAGRIARSALYKTVLRRVAVAAAVGSSGVGIPIALLMLQGIIERASEARKRLMKDVPALYGMLYRRQLEMAYFLVEEHVAALKRTIAGKLRSLASASREAK